MVNPFLDAVDVLRHSRHAAAAENLRLVITDPSDAFVERVAYLALVSRRATRVVLRTLGRDLSYDEPWDEETALLREARDELTTRVIVDAGDDRYRCTLCGVEGPVGTGLPHGWECLIQRLYEAAP